MRIKIDGEFYEVDNVLDYGHLPMIEVGDMEFYLAEDSEVAGKVARTYWEGMANDDPAELTAILGSECLVAWGLGESYAPGSIGVDSLQDWLDLWLDTPEEQWASYDSMELDVDVCGRQLSEELGFVPTVAYRHN